MKLKQGKTFHVTVNLNSIVQHKIQIKKWNNKTFQYECKNYCTCRKYYSWNPSTCICEKSSVQWNYICYGYYIKKKTKTIATNVSLNSGDTK